MDSYQASQTIEGKLFLANIEVLPKLYFMYKPIKGIFSITLSFSRDIWKQLLCKAPVSKSALMLAALMNAESCHRSNYFLKENMFTIGLQFEYCCIMPNKLTLNLEK